MRALRVAAGVALAMSLALACASVRAAGERASTVTAGGTASTREGLIAYLDADGIGVVDPRSGRQRLLLPISGIGRRVLVSGPVWGRDPGGRSPVLYFSVHDARGGGRPAYDWLFRADPWRGTLTPLAATVDYTGSGPEDLVAAGSRLAFSYGCCEDIGVFGLPLASRPAPPHSLAAPTAGPVFLVGGASSGRLVVTTRQHWQWLDPANGRRSPFTRQAALERLVHSLTSSSSGPPSLGPLSFSSVGAQAAVAIRPGGVAIFQLSGPTGLRLLKLPLPPNPSLSWSPALPALAVAETNGVRLVGTGTGGLPSGLHKGRLLAGRSVTSVSWSAPTAPASVAAARRLPSFWPLLDRLLAATARPSQATTLYLWRYDGSQRGNVTSIIAGISGVPSAQLLASYPPLLTLRAADEPGGWWVPTGWLLGSPYCYRAVTVAGAAPLAAVTLGLDGGCGPLSRASVAGPSAPPRTRSRSATAKHPELAVRTGVLLGALFRWPHFPASVQLDNHDGLSRLRWTQPTARTAVARGDLLVDLCTRSCAAGPVKSFPVELEASRPKVCTVPIYDRSNGSITRRRAYVYSSLRGRLTHAAGAPPVTRTLLRFPAVCGPGS